jgi:hypothetical protein
MDELSGCGVRNGSQRCWAPSALLEREAITQMTGVPDADILHGAGRTARVGLCGVEPCEVMPPSWARLRKTGVVKPATRAPCGVQILILAALAPPSAVCYTDKVGGLLPYFIAADRSRRCIVLSIRGSMSLR